jgi:hypothetical protein
MLLLGSHVGANTVRDQHLGNGLQEQILRRRKGTEGSVKYVVLPRNVKAQD